MNRDQFVHKRAQYETRHVERSAAPEPSRHVAPQLLSLETSGFSLLIDGRSVFLPFCDHPALAAASGDKLRQVRRTDGNQLYWPALDVSVSLSQILR